MHCELPGAQKVNAGPAGFEVPGKCQGAPLKELPRVTRPSAGKALSNPQMSFKITVSNGSEHTEPQQSPPEMSAPLLDFVPKRASIFERIPVLPRAQELRCARGSKDYFQQQKHQSLKGESKNARIEHYHHIKKKIIIHHLNKNMHQALFFFLVFFSPFFLVFSIFSNLFIKLQALKLFFFFPFPVHLGGAG